MRPADAIPKIPIETIWNVMPRKLGTNTFLRRSRLNSIPTKNIMNITPSSPSAAMFSDEPTTPATGESNIPTMMNPSSCGSFSIEKIRMETVAATIIIAISLMRSSVEWLSIRSEFAGARRPPRKRFLI